MTRSQRAASAGSWVTSTKRGAALGLAGEHQVDDLAPGRLVEIAGRLVGDQDRRDAARARGRARRAAARRRRAAPDSATAARRARPPRARARRARRRRRAPASSSGTATFSSAVMVGIRWNDWKTMPTWRPRKRASASSSSRPRSSPATTTEPVSGRSSPAMTISSVDLPEPDGPTRPTASPRPIFRVMSLRMCTRAAPRAEREIDPRQRDGRRGGGLDRGIVHAAVAIPPRGGGKMALFGDFAAKLSAASRLARIG